MTRHLTDMELAVLLSGAGAPSERARYAGHLAECIDCLRDFLESAREFAVAAGGNGVDEGSPSSPPVDAAELAAVQGPEAGPGAAGGERPVPLPPDRETGTRPGAEPGRETGTKPGYARGHERALRLVRPREELDEAMGAAEEEAALPWAAAATLAKLPVLATEDGMYRVRFRRPDPGGPLRAHLIADLPAAASGTFLQVLTRGTSFAFGPDGTVDLPGIETEDLASGNLVLRMTAREGEDERAGEGETAA